MSFVTIHPSIKFVYGHSNVACLAVLTRYLIDNVCLMSRREWILNFAEYFVDHVDVSVCQTYAWVFLFQLPFDTVRKMRYVNHGPVSIFQDLLSRLFGWRCMMVLILGGLCDAGGLWVFGHTVDQTVAEVWWKVVELELVVDN